MADPDQTALLLKAVDLLPFGVVACDATARLSFGNRMIERMVGGLRTGQPASDWSATYGLADDLGRAFTRVEDIPLARALSGPMVSRARMRQRCGAGSIELIAHARAVRDPSGRLHGAVGIFVPVAMIAGRPQPGSSAEGRPAIRRPRQVDPLLLADAIGFAEQVTETANAVDELIDRVIEYVRLHQTQNIRLTDIAAALGYSATHLTTLVRRHTGEPLMRLIQRIRLESACSLLELTDLPVAVVAGRCGPWDADYFARLFHRHYGCSPSAWRVALAPRRIVGEGPKIGLAGPATDGESGRQRHRP